MKEDASSEFIWPMVPGHTQDKSTSFVRRVLEAGLGSVLNQVQSSCGCESAMSTKALVGIILCYCYEAIYHPAKVDAHDSDA